MPVTCCSTASTTPIAKAVRMPGWKSWASEPLSVAIAASIAIQLGPARFPPR